jgi:Putative zinc-finger
MKCDEVQSQLSEYLDKSIDAPRARGIDAHLASCAVCKREFYDLLACRRLIAALPIVEPPLGFTTRVMAQIADGAHQRPFWYWLLSPLKIGLSLQVGAVALIALVAVYYGRTPESTSPPEQVASTPTDELKPPKSPVVRINEPSTGNPEPVQPPSDNVRRDPSTVEPKPERIVSPQLHRSVPRRDRVRDNSKGDAEPIGRMRNSISPYFVNFGGRGEGFGSFAMPSYNAVPVRPDYILHVRPGRRQASTSVSSTDGQNSEDATAGEQPVSDTPSLIFGRDEFIEVPQDEYPRFKKRLTAEGRIEQEIPVAIQGREWSFRPDRPLYIQVKWLASGE